MPIHVVTQASQLPTEFLDPSPERQLVIGFDCEGVDLCRHGTLCIMQVFFMPIILDLVFYLNLQCEEVFHLETSVLHRVSGTRLGFLH